MALQFARDRVKAPGTGVAYAAGMAWRLRFFGALLAISMTLPGCRFLYGRVKAEIVATCARSCANAPSGTERVCVEQCEDDETLP